ncbi:MAG: hypothetical protein MI923_08105 [Phycisphaerales bacterium]|nr:hypothetical protein [Phycisphaerales bacterium]
MGSNQTFTIPAQGDAGEKRINGYTTHLTEGLAGASDLYVARFRAASHGLNGYHDYSLGRCQVRREHAGRRNRADMNCDGTPNGLDVQRFTEELLSP